MNEIQQYLQNKDLIKKSYQTQELDEQRLKEKQRKETDIIEDQMGKLRNQIYDIKNKYEEIKEANKKTRDEQREELGKHIKKVDKKLFFLSLDQTKKDLFYLDKVQGSKRTQAELIEKYESKTTRLGLFVAENKRDVNKFNVSVIGYCPFTQNSVSDSMYGTLRNDLISTWNLKGWEIDLPWLDDPYTRDSIKHDIKFFKDRKSAITYAKKGLDKIFATQMKQIRQLDKEYEETIQKEDIKNYSEIIEKNLIDHIKHHWGHSSDADLEEFINKMKPIRKVTMQEARRLIRSEEN